MSSLYGMSVRTDENLGEWVQFRFPKTKKRRIRRKWAKRRSSYHFIPSNEAYQLGNQLYCHPALLEKILKSGKVAVEREAEEMKPYYLSNIQSGLQIDMLSAELETLPLLSERFCCGYD